MQSYEKQTYNILNYLCFYLLCGARSPELERRLCNHKVESSYQDLDRSIAYIFDASTCVVPRKENLQRLVHVPRTCFSIDETFSYYIGLQIPNCLFLR